MEKQSFSIVAVRQHTYIQESDLIFALRFVPKYLRRFYLVVDAVEIGVETLVEPPAGMADLSTDVAGVWRAEYMLVVVPTKRILHRPTETGHMEAVPALLALYPAGEKTSLSDKQTFSGDEDGSRFTDRCSDIFVQQNL